MKRCNRKTIVIMLIVAVISMIPVGVYAASLSSAKPKITKISVAGRQVTVKYGKVKNAKYYRVYRVIKNKNGKKSYKSMAVSTTTTAKFMGAYNTKYDLVVRAFNGKKKSKMSAIKSKKIGGSNTYVFFGTDSRAKDDSWKDVNSSSNRGSGSDYPRSDVIMIIKLNPSNMTLDVVSVYRDTVMNVGKNKVEFGKINSAYGMYGPKEAVKILEKDLNIKIEGYVVANFKGVADAIDEMGGISLKIEKDAIQEPYRTKLNTKTVPELMNKIIDGHKALYGKKYGKHVSNSLTKKAGKLDGSQAVAYARVRYTDGSDKRRTVRQRAVLNAAVNKFKTLSYAEKIRVLQTIYPSIDTNISKKKLISILVKKNDTKKGLTYSLSARTVNSLNPKKGKENLAGFPFYKKDVYTDLKTKYKNADGSTNERAYVTMPCDLSKNVTQLHKKLYKESIYKPSSTVKSINKSGLNKKAYIKKKGKYVKTTTKYVDRTRSQDNKY